MKEHHQGSWHMTLNNHASTCPKVPGMVVPVPKTGAPVLTSPPPKATTPATVMSNPQNAENGPFHKTSPPSPWSSPPTPSFPKVRVPKAQSINPQEDVTELTLAFAPMFIYVPKSIKAEGLSIPGYPTRPPPPLPKQPTTTPATSSTENPTELPSS